MLILNKSWYELSQMLIQTWPGLFFSISLLLIGVLLFMIWKMRIAISSNKALQNFANEFQEAGIPTYSNSLPLLKKELDRLRRYNRHLAVVVLQIEGPSTNGKLKNYHTDDTNGNGSRKNSPGLDLGDDVYPVNNENDNGNRYNNGNGNGSGSDNGHNNGNDEGIHVAINQSIELQQLTIMIYGYIVRDLLRECDIITYDAMQNQFIIFLPETTRSQATQSVERLNRLVSERTKAHFNAGIVEFPTDAYTIEDLVRTAMTKVGEPLNGSYNIELEEVENFERKKAS